MNIEYANTIPMRKVLEKLGLRPVGKTLSELLYQSPFDKGHEPSFIVDVKTNTWKDFADNSEGNVVDFVCKHLRASAEPHTPTDAERWINNIVGNVVLQAPKGTKDHSQNDKQYQYVEHQQLSAPYLIHYVEQIRGIPADIARLNLSEVTVRDLQTGKTFLALGHKTENGSFSIRNEFIKAQLKRPYISFIRGTKPKTKELHIFKDIFDYLSAIVPRMGTPFQEDVLILNTYVNMPLSAGFIYGYGYTAVCTWLENNDVGIEATCNYSTYLKTEPDLVHKQMNKRYQSFESLNAWLLGGMPTSIA